MSSSPPSCCPPDSSEPFARSPSDYVPQGKMIDINCPGGGKAPMPTYIVGDESSSKCLLILADIYGIHSGRHKVIADELAHRCGYFVVMPDVFRNDPPFTEQEQNFQKALDNYVFKHLETDLVEAIYPYCRSSNNRRKVASLGFCYGAYLWCMMASHVTFEALVSPHPSIFNAAKHAKDDLSTAIAAIKCPVYLLNAPEDPPEQQPGGNIQRILTENGNTDSVFETMENDVKHGWSCRGDVSDPVIKQAVNESFERICNFLDKHF